MIARTARLLDAAMSDAAPFRDANRVWNNPGPEVAGNFSLNKQIATARREMGEARWKQLNAEWNAK